MPNLTLAISGQTKKNMEKYHKVRWSKVVRTIIERKIEDFEIAEKLVKKSKLSEKDAEKLSLRANHSIAEHAKRLLSESDN